MSHTPRARSVAIARKSRLTIAAVHARAQLRAMSTVTFHRVLALLGYVSCLAAAPAVAQMGPIQPMLVTDGKVEFSQDRPDLGGDFSVPVEVHVSASGETSGNLQADALAVAFMRDKKYLPGLNAKGLPVASVLKVVVNMYKRGSKK